MEGLSTRLAAALWPGAARKAKRGEVMLKAFVVLATLSGVVLVSVTGRVAAQHTDAQEGRIDAMFGTPGRYGVTPQDNIFATTPGLEQQARRHGR